MEMFMSHIGEIKGQQRERLEGMKRATEENQRRIWGRQDELAEAKAPTQTVKDYQIALAVSNKNKQISSKRSKDTFMLYRQAILKQLRGKAIAEKKAEIQKSKSMRKWAKHVKLTTFLVHMVDCKNRRVLKHKRLVKRFWIVFQVKNRFQTHCLRRINLKMAIEGYKQKIIHEKKRSGEYGYQFDEDFSLTSVPFNERFDVLNIFFSTQRVRMAFTFVTPAFFRDAKVKAAEKILKFLTNLK